MDDLVSVKIDQNAESNNIDPEQTTRTSGLGSSKSTLNNQMLTINYFGNIQDSLIGQIKTRIPIAKKVEMVRTFKSPAKPSYSNAEEPAGYSSSILTQNLVTRQEHVRHISFKRENQRIFYANIGQEPLIVNKYVRPHGLASFKLAHTQSQAEIEYNKRKELFALERDLKKQYEILRSQNAQIRGSMLKDPASINPGGSVRHIKRKATVEMRPREFTLAPAASQPQLQRASSKLKSDKKDRLFNETGSKLLKGSLSKMTGSKMVQTNEKEEEQRMQREASGITPTRKKPEYL